MKLPRSLKRLLWTSFPLLYACGVTYWLSRLFLRKAGAFGDEPHFLERVLGPVHLIVAFFFIFVTGIVWTQHASIAQRLGKSRFSGWAFFALLGSLALTGIAIVYGSEQIEKLAGQVHPWIGASLLPLLLIHIVTKKKSTHSV